MWLSPRVETQNIASPLPPSPTILWIDPKAGFTKHDTNHRKNIEEFAIKLLECLGYEHLYGPDTGEDYGQPLLLNRLREAIARVNRVYKDKPGGLVVDYLGIASNLKKALSFYSGAGGKGDPAIAQEEAVDLMTEKLEVVSGMYNDSPAAGLLMKITLRPAPAKNCP